MIKTKYSSDWLVVNWDSEPGMEAYRRALSAQKYLTTEERQMYYSGIGGGLIPVNVIKFTDIVTPVIGIDSTPTVIKARFRDFYAGEPMFGNPMNPRPATFMHVSLAYKYRNPDNENFLEFQDFLVGLGTFDTRINDTVQVIDIGNAYNGALGQELFRYNYELYKNEEYVQTGIVLTYSDQGSWAYGDMHEHTYPDFVAQPNTEFWFSIEQVG